MLENDPRARIDTWRCLLFHSSEQVYQILPSAPEAQIPLESAAALANSLHLSVDSSGIRTNLKEVASGSLSGPGLVSPQSLRTIVSASKAKIRKEIHLLAIKGQSFLQMVVKSNVPTDDNQDAEFFNFLGAPDQTNKTHFREFRAAFLRSSTMCRGLGRFSALGYALF